MTTGRWQTNLVITLVVFFTLVIGFLMAQLDFVSFAGAPTETSVSVVSSDVTPTETTLPVVPIPSNATATPESNNGSSSQGKATNTPMPEGAMPCVSPPDHWIPYVVQSEDTILSLSIAFETSQEEIIQFNCLTARTLTVGSTILVPGITPTPKVCNDPPDAWRLYTIQQGDTMFSLARFRGVTVLEVMNANCLTSPSIKAGDELYLPTTIVITATPSPQPTATVEPSATSLPQPTDTPAPLPTATLTPEPLPTATGTLTATPTQTNTPTATATVTASPTSTATNTAVPTNTSTPLPTETPTLAPTETLTPVPTSTLTPVPTETPTVPPTDTPTSTPTIEPGS